MAEGTLSGAGQFVRLPVDMHYRDELGRLMTRGEQFPVVYDISEEFVGWLTFQWRRHNEPDSAFRDIEGARFDGPTNGRLLLESSGWVVQLGFKSGDYTSGSAKVILI